MTNNEKPINLEALEETIAYREQNIRASSEIPKDRGHGHEEQLCTLAHTPMLSERSLKARTRVRGHTAFAAAIPHGLFDVYYENFTKILPAFYDFVFLAPLYFAYCSIDRRKTWAAYPRWITIAASALSNFD
jgi:hypothetical protein